MKRPSGKVPLEAKGIAKAYDRKPVFAGFGTVLNRGEKVVLVGRNAVAKTTLLKALMADAPDMTPSPADVDAGEVRWGHGVPIGYFPQDSTGETPKGMHV